jgi:hypothetical protein
VHFRNIVLYRNGGTMKIPEILSKVNLDEEQIKALDTFFKEWTEEIKTAERKKAVTEAKIPEGYVKTEDAEKAFNLFKKDAEKAFDLFNEDAEKAFDLAKTEWHEEFNQILEDKQTQYTESFARAMQDVYEEIESRVRNDFQTSEEYRAFQVVKKAVLPVILTEDQKEMLDKINDMERKEAMLAENEKELNKQNAISTLLADFPSEYVETVKKFVSKAVNEEEVYSRFNEIVELIDKGAVNKNGKPAVTIESVEPAAKAVFKRKIQQSKRAAEKPQKASAKPVFESATGAEKKPVKEELKKNKLGLTQFEDTIISLAFPRQTI